MPPVRRASAVCNSASVDTSAAAGAERHGQRRIGADLDGHGLPCAGRALGQQVGRVDRADRQPELGQQRRRRAGDRDRGVGVGALEDRLPVSIERRSQQSGRRGADGRDAVGGEVAERSRAWRCPPRGSTTLPLSEVQTSWPLTQPSTETPPSPPPIASSAALIFVATCGRRVGRQECRERAPRRRR